MLTHEEKQIHNAVHAELREFEEFKELVKQMREAQKKEWEIKSKQTCGKELDEHTKVVIKLESEVDEYLEKMGE